MKITKIKINEYKILKRNLIELTDDQIFPEGSQILGLIGSNGSGKTTLCSMITWTFQSMFTRSELDFNINIEFQSEKIHKTIKCKNNSFTLLIDNKIYYQFKLGKKFKKYEREQHSNIILKFWDGNIILSTFETSGEYPNKKAYNFIGRDPLVKFDVAQIYGNNIFSYPSISKGIFRFLSSLEKQNIANTFLEKMGFKLSGKIEIKIVRSVADYRTRENINSMYNGLFRNDSVEKEEALYKLLRDDSRIELTSETQMIDSYTALALCNDYSEYIGKYIFLNGLGLIKDDIELTFDNLSSGEKFLIIRYLSILSGAEKNSIIVVEEPENHLNPKWRELVIPALHKISTAYDSVLIFTTHDHRIIRYLHNNCVLNITKGVVNKIDTPVLLCDEFDFESISEKAIPFVYEDLYKVYSEMNKTEKAKLINSMCDVEEKMILRKKYLEKYAKN